MRVLVTGGAGFIGSHTVDRLLEEGHSVVALDVLDPQVHGKAKKPRFLAKKAAFVRGDVRKRESIAKAIAKCEAVLHLAAQVGVGQSMYRPEQYVDVNARGTAALLDVLAGGKHTVKKLVVASSMSIYGEGAYYCSKDGARAPRLRAESDLAAGRWEPKCDLCGGALERKVTPETKPLDPTSVYAVSKKTQEELCLVFGAHYGIPSVALRYFNVWGPRQSLSNPYTGVAAIFTSRLLNDRSPIVFEDGAQSRDFVHVRDVARANVAALTKSGGDGEALNVGTGRATTVVEIARLLAERLGKKIAPEINGKYRPGDIRHCIADPSKLEKAYGFRPTTTLAEGIDELIDWSRGEEAKDRIDVAMKELRQRRLVR